MPQADECYICGETLDEFEGWQGMCAACADYWDDAAEISLWRIDHEVRHSRHYGYLGSLPHAR